MKRRTRTTCLALTFGTLALLGQGQDLAPLSPPPAVEQAAGQPANLPELTLGEAVEQAIAQAKALYGIEGIVYGGISSNYQKQAFDEICARLKLTAIAPLWNAEPQEYMNTLVEQGFSIMIVGVSAMGLDKEWLGKQIDRAALKRLDTLSKKYGFNLTFEGGEAETLVIDCPIFHKRLQINSAKTHWDGQRGIFEIQDVALVEK